MRSAHRRTALARAPLLLLVACGGGGDGGGTEPTPPPGPDPGLVDVVLATPHPDDGGLIVRVQGATVTDVRSVGYSLRAAGAGTSTVRIIVRGEIAPGTLLRIQVPDRRSLASYSAVVEQAAQRGTYQQRALTGYTLSLRAAP